MPYSAALWAYFIAKRVQGMEVAAQKAQDLGSYHLESLIGRGGMGEVWRARHKMLAREAAIKIIRPELMQDASARQADVAVRRFEREARVTADLQSPHTVYLYDFGTSRDGHFYFVMELLDGISLQKLVQTFGPQPGSRVIHLLRQVCLSLEEAHARGLVHRDLKPSNIMACKVALQHDFVKVLDFGLVKPTQAEEFTHLTVEGVSAGTPGYIAPEIAMGEERIDGRADLYTLGCVAYYLLTGTLVFTETSPTAMAVAHVQKPPVPPSERTELPISADLEAVVLQCLAKKAGGSAGQRPGADSHARCLRGRQAVVHRRCRRLVADAPAALVVAPDPGAGGGTPDAAVARAGTLKPNRVHRLPRAHGHDGCSRHAGAPGRGQGRARRPVPRDPAGHRPAADDDPVVRAVGDGGAGLLAAAGVAGAEAAGPDRLRGQRHRPRGRVVLVRCRGRDPRHRLHPRRRTRRAAAFGVLVAHE